MASPQQGKARTGLTLEIRRTIAAPRERVFAAWTDLAQLEKWMCKDVPAHEVFHREQDIRTGGHFLLEVRDPEKGEVYWGQGDYLEVKPPEKLVFTWSWKKQEEDGSRTEMHPDSPETKVTVEFFDHGKSTELVLTHGMFRSNADFKDHDRGWNGCLDKLEVVLGVARTM